MSYSSRARLLTILVTIAVGMGLATSAVPASAVVPKDTGLLAFVRSNQIYTSTTTGTSVKLLTTSGKNYRPHWSPDGRRIAYVHEAPAGVRNIWVMNANGSSKLQVTHLGDTTEPTWSPDGKWLAFGAHGTTPEGGLADGRLQKIRSTAPFGSPVVMPSAADSHVDPFVQNTLAWSPDGTKIVFASDNFPDSPDHYMLLYTIATKQVDELGGVGGGCCGEGYFRDPTWTNDSKSVALTELLYDPSEENPPAGPHIALWSVPDRTRGTYPDITGDRDPDYSPTGKKLVFSHWSRIYISNANGAHRKDVINGYYPDWQPVFG